MKYRLFKVGVYEPATSVPAGRSDEVVTEPTRKYRLIKVDACEPPAAALAELTHEKVGEEALVKAVTAWTGGDHTRWARVLQRMKQNWEPTWSSDSPRHVLVAWASVNARRVEAKEQGARYERMGRLTNRLGIGKRAREADVSCFTRLATALGSRAGLALVHDLEAAGTLRTLCSSKGKAQ